MMVDGTGAPVGGGASPIVFSVIIPTYDRPFRLRRCLQALARLDYPQAAFEVCVVDDGGRNSAMDVVADFRDILNVTGSVQRHAGPAVARNTGAGRARGQFLVFTDDDCAPAPGWLTALQTAFAASPHGLIGGRTINALTDNRCASASQILIDYLYSYYNAESGVARFFATNNFALRADDFSAIGGFDVRFSTAGGEDREFCDRWGRNGRPMRYAPHAVVYHCHDLSFPGFLRQHFRYGRGAAAFRLTRQAQTASRQPWREPLSFYFDLVRYPFTARSFGDALPLSALLMVAQIATALGFARELLARGVRR